MAWRVIPASLRDASYSSRRDPVNSSKPSPSKASLPGRTGTANRISAITFPPFGQCCGEHPTGDLKLSRPLRTGADSLATDLAALAERLCAQLGERADALAERFEALARFRA